jgi:molybdopterin/thiamine biosynthesis adenylyltransferase
VLKPYETDADGRRTPATAIFSRKSRRRPHPVCAEAGVIGALTGVIGTLMAMEASS